MFTKRYNRKLELQRRAGLFRNPPPIQQRQGKYVHCNGRRRHLADLSRWTRTELTRQGFRVGGDAHVLPVLIGPEQLAVEIARQLYEHGIFVLPARYPTVPLQQAILRVSLTADHEQEDVTLFINALKEIYANQTSTTA